MNLVKELIALNESTKKKMYQIRFDNHPYEDVELHIRDLETLYKELTMNLYSKEASEHLWGDVAELNSYVQEYHGVYNDEKRNKVNGVFDAVDEDFEVESFEHDVLKIAYHFTIRYDGEKSRKVKGTVSLMPGN